MSKDVSGDVPRVLVCEDEQIVSLDIQMHLNSLGYTVPATFSRAEEVIGFLEKGPVDLVLMDIHLKGEMDGIAAAEIIHRRFDIPVVILTAYADDATLQRAKLSEPFAYIIKPFEERKLQTTLVVALHRHRMEREIRDRERLLSTVLSAINNGVIVTGDSGTVEYANGRARDLLGISAGMHVDAAFPTSIRSGALKGVTRFDTNSVSQGLRSIDVAGFVVPGEPAGRVVWAFLDVTEEIERERSLQEQERQLNRAERMEAIGRFSGGIAHDFNNLITVIMGYTRVILADLENGRVNADSIRDSLSDIHETAKRSSQLTRQLLSFSRNDVHRPELVDINDALWGFRSVVRKAIPGTIDVLYALRADQSTVRIDPYQFEQVVLNLAMNARDAMSGGGTLAVSTESIRVDGERVLAGGSLSAGTYVVVRVVDTGYGIEPEDLPHIFEPFFSTKQAEYGTGLGLASVFGIVEASGGVIDVVSTVGHGSTFALYLPIAAGGQLQSQPERRLNVPGGTETIVVVQDNETLRAMVTHTLRVHGYQTHSARNVGEAIIMAEHIEGISVVVSDLSAPFLSEKEIVHRLSTAARGAAVVLTVDFERLVEGPVVLITKPFDPVEMLLAVRTGVELYLNEQQNA